MLCKWRTGHITAYFEAEAPWATYNRGKPLSARQLAKRLKEFKIHSKDMRIPPFGKNLKGYAHDDFSEAFSRYIPSSPSEVLRATTRQISDSESSSNFNKCDNHNMSLYKNSQEPISHAICSAVADNSTDFDNILREEPEELEV